MLSVSKDGIFVLYTEVSGRCSGRFALQTIEHGTISGCHSFRLNN